LISRKSLLVVIGVGALLAGCDAKERTALQARSAQLDKEIAAKKAIAQNLEPFRTETAAAEQQIAALKAKLHRPAAADLNAALDALKLKEAAVKDDGARLVGDGGGAQLASALHAFDAKASAVVLKQLTVDGKKWTAELVFPAEPVAPAPAAVEPKAAAPAKLPPMPEQSFMAGAETKALRDRVAKAEKELAALDKAVVEVEQVSAKQDAARAELAALQAVKLDDRLAATLPVAEQLFGGAKPVLTKGTAEFAGAVVKLTKVGKAAAVVKKLAPLGKATASGKDAVDFEPTPAAPATK
jgi:hypothetical protein